MSKLLEETIAEVRKLSMSEQDAAAFALIDYLDHREQALTDEQRAEVSRRISDPARVLVSYDEARAYILRPRS